MCTRSTKFPGYEGGGGITTKFATISAEMAQNRHEVAHGAPFGVVETCGIPAGIAQIRHEVAYWEPFGVMGTFMIPGKSFQCAHEVGGFHDTGGVGTLDTMPCEPVARPEVPYR